MINSILVVCTGNICRSPLGEALLRAGLAPSEIRVGSAGIGALDGYPADPVTREVARAHGVDLDAHVARQFTAQLGQDHSLILAMERLHRRAILEVAPQLSGRIMLFDHWTEGQGVPDPHKRERAFHDYTFTLIDAAARAWTQRLAGTSAP